MRRTALLLLLLLVGCQTDSEDVSVKLPSIPQYYIDCFKKEVKIPKGEPLTRDKIIHLIAEFVQSDRGKSQCGKDLVAWYNTVKKQYAVKKR